MKGDDLELRVSGIKPEHQEPLRDALKTSLARKVGMPIVRFVNDGPEKRLTRPDGVCVWANETPEGTTVEEFRGLIEAAFQATNQPQPTVDIGI